jgi:hypothetical protein
MLLQFRVDCTHQFVVSVAIPPVFADQPVGDFGELGDVSYLAPLRRVNSAHIPAWPLPNPASLMYAP